MKLLPDDGPSTALIAILGTEPQVVRLALQALAGRGEAIGEVIVVHTAPREPRIAEAVRRLDTAFAGEERLAPWRGHYLRTAILGQAGPVPGMLAEEDFGATLAASYRLVRNTKQAGYRVHLNLSGGRKPMSLCGTTVAQLLFDGDDRLLVPAIEENHRIPARGLCAGVRQQASVMRFMTKLAG